MGEITLTTLPETGPGTTLTLHPGWSLAAEQRLEAARHRARDGGLYAYRWGTHAAFTLPLGFVPSAARATLRAWWRAGERLLFTLDSSAARGHALCRLAAPLAPLDVRVPGLALEWAGALVLEAVDGRLRLGLPFRLDDPAQGRLDDRGLSLI